MRINCKWVQEIWGRGIDAKCSKTRLWSWRHNSVNLLFKNLFIYGCAGSLLLCGLVSGCSEQGLLQSQCMGFSLTWLLLLWSTGSSHESFNSRSTQARQLWPLELAGFRSCSAWGHYLWCKAQFLHGIWNLPGPEIKPVSPSFPMYTQGSPINFLLNVIVHLKTVSCMVNIFASIKLLFKNNKTMIVISNRIEKLYLQEDAMYTL